MIGIFPHPYIHGHLYKILSASITASVAMSSLHHWFIAAIVIGGPVSGFLLENGHRPNIIFLVADDLGECWLGSTYLFIAAKPAEFRILYNVSGCHGVRVSRCHGVTVSRCHSVTVSVRRSWKRLALSITLLADQLPAVPN